MTNAASSGRPTFNHVGITLPPSELDDAGRAELLDFYGEVFGWVEGDSSSEDGNPLIMHTGAFGEFVYLLPGNPAMTAPSLDHVGLLAETMEELDEILVRAKAYAARDDRVRIIGKSSRPMSGPSADYTLTSCYVGFRLPLMFEVQHLERHERAD